MSDYPGDLLPFSSAYLLSQLPRLHERVILDPSAPSSVRVFGKSLFIVAAGWMAAITWLWLEAMPASLSAVEAVIPGVAPALLLSLAGWLFSRYLGQAPYRELQWREWRHACGWAIVPNALMLVTVWIMVTPSA